MKRIPTTPVENLFNPTQASPPTVVRASTSYAEPTCVDASGHVISCSVCKKLGLLEKTVYVLISAILSSLITGFIIVRLYKR